MHTADESPVGYALHVAGCISITFIAVVACGLVGWLVYQLLRDMFRFGRQHLHFGMMIGLLCLISVTGCIFVGAFGLIIGPVLLVPYGIGWMYGGSHA
jgi:hypothetical protein